MTLDEIAAYNADWLRAWTDKDVERLIGFYAAGLTGHDALRAYLTGLFGATPAMTYTPDEVWPIPGGFCGRWYCDIAGAGRMRGFDLVILDGDRIALNEVYVHMLGA